MLAALGRSVAGVFSKAQPISVELSVGASPEKAGGFVQLLIAADRGSRRDPMQLARLCIINNQATPYSSIPVIGLI